MYETLQVWNICYVDISTNIFAKIETGSLSTVDLKLSRKATTIKKKKGRRKKIRLSYAKSASRRICCVHLFLLGLLLRKPEMSSACTPGGKWEEGEPV